MSEQLIVRGTDGKIRDVSDSNGYPIQQTGSKVIGPTLLATITAAQFTASTTKFQTLSGTLSRNAKVRTIMVVNSLDQGITTTTIYMYDSINNTATNKVVNFTLTTPVASGMTVDTSENKPLLATHVDSFMIGFAIGATAPLSGDVKVYMTEIM
jgi:DNA replication protein DnaD